jgi:hypothetical protein
MLMAGPRAHEFVGAAQISFNFSRGHSRDLTQRREMRSDF